MGHFVTLGPLTSPNLNISTIWVRDPWVSIQIHFWGSLLPTKEVLHTCKIVYFFNRWFTLSHFVILGPLTSPNLNISTIWVRDHWVSIQINFWGSLPPTGEVPHICKIIHYFKLANYFGSFFSHGSTHISEFEYLVNIGYKSFIINLNQLLGLPTSYRRSTA